jgi:thiamine-phosphate pyrophosphorylase
MKSLSDCFLYAFVDTAYLNGRTPELLAQQLCDGGADIVQLRAKQSTVEDIRQMAEAILPITRTAGVPLVINDYPQVANDVGAECLHLGQEDFFRAGRRHVSELRTVGSDLWIGLSTHAPEQATRALSAGADYVAIGPVYPTATKPGVQPVTLDYVRWAAANVQVPWFAIGGIHLNNLGDVLAAGARRVCVVSAILNSDEVSATCRRFKERLLKFSNR